MQICNAQCRERSPKGWKDFLFKLLLFYHKKYDFYFTNPYFFQSLAWLNLLARQPPKGKPSFGQQLCGGNPSNKPHTVLYVGGVHWGRELSQWSSEYSDTGTLIACQTNLPVVRYHPFFSLIEWVVSRATIGQYQVSWISKWVGTG